MEGYALFEGMSEDTAIGLLAGGIMGIGFSVIIAIVIAWWVVQVIASWKIFKKFGEPGWKAIIPIYSTYVRYQAIWNSKMFAVLVVLCVLSCMNNIGAGTFVGTVFNILSLIAAIAFVVVEVMAEHRLSKSFGHGTGFTVGLVLLGLIFRMILGFGSSLYIGNPDSWDNTAR